MSAYLINILSGLWITVGVAVAALGVASVLGLLGALAKLSSSKVLQLIGDVYTTLIRGVPDLVWMLLLFYGGQIALNAFLKLLSIQTRIEINPFVAGVLTIGFVYGAYFAETFRGAILSVPKGQAEAGLAYGMGRFYVFKRIVFPQMVRFALPSFTNNWLVLVKSTALVSMLGLSDITNLANQAGASARGDIPGAAMIFLGFAALLYLLITTISMWLLKLAETKYSVGVKRGTVQ